MLYAYVESVTWIFCPGHCGVRGNERADKLAGAATEGETITFDPPAVLLAVKEKLASDEDVTSFTTSLLIEKGIQRGDGLRSALRGPSRRIQNQLTFETISTKTLLWSLQRRDEQLWQCAVCSESSSS